MYIFVTTGYVSHLFFQRVPTKTRMPEYGTRDNADVRCFLVTNFYVTSDLIRMPKEQSPRVDGVGINRVIVINRTKK